MLGDEDALLDGDNARYSTSCHCISQIAEVYELKSKDLLREFEKLNNYDEMIKVLIEKKNRYIKRIDNKKEIQKNVNRKLSSGDQEEDLMKNEVDKWTDDNVANQNMVNTHKNFHRKLKRCKFTNKDPTKGKAKHESDLK